VRIANTDKDCDLLWDIPVLSTGRTPHEKQNRNCIDYNENLVMSTGVARHHGGLTGARHNDLDFDWQDFRLHAIFSSLL